MVNRTGTYFAFDGLGEKNPSLSDFKYYATVQSWAANENIDFNVTNSHDKAAAVRDTSQLKTLKDSIRKRLKASKNMVIILSDDTRKSGSLLSYEIEQAVDWYEIPLIIAHTGCDSILKPTSLKRRWPNALTLRIENKTAKAIHIPFKQSAILDAIKQFTVNSNNLSAPLHYYDSNTHKKWGYI